MKKVLMSLTIVALFGIAAAVYAYDSGAEGQYTCPGYGSGYGMMGPGHGGHMMGWRGGSNQKYLDETADLRKELHTKKFAYFEAVRNPKTDSETIRNLRNDISELKDKIHAKAPQGPNRGYGRSCWQF
jgi:hypothetical protein